MYLGAASVSLDLKCPFPNSSLLSVISKCNSHGRKEPSTDGKVAVTLSTKYQLIVSSRGRTKPRRSTSWMDSSFSGNYVNVL